MQNTYNSGGNMPPTNGVSSQPHQGSADQQWMQTPTVSEALPFTPFSSIIPFNPGMYIPDLWLVNFDPSHAVSFNFMRL